MRCTEPSEMPVALAIARPVQWGRLMRRHGAEPAPAKARESGGQRHHPRRGIRRDRRFAGLAGLVAQQTVNPALGNALLPPTHRQPADAKALRYPLRRVPIRRGEHNTGPFSVLARPVAVDRNRCQVFALRGAQHYAYLLCHGPHPPMP